VIPRNYSHLILNVERGFVADPREVVGAVELDDKLPLFVLELEQLVWNVIVRNDLGRPPPARAQLGPHRVVDFGEVAVAAVDAHEVVSRHLQVVLVQTLGVVGARTDAARSYGFWVSNLTRKRWNKLFC
jgi:hypothetical protein